MKDLKLAAYWHDRYQTERTKRAADRRALKLARSSRDRWRSLARGYERVLRIKR